MFSAHTRPVHPVAPRAQEADLHPQTPEAAGTIYADIQHTPAKERAVQDRSLTTFDTPNAQVVPERLVKLSPRFGLAPIKELEQAGLTDARVANATWLPKGGAQSASMLFGFPGDTNNPRGAERQARLGCALLEQGVTHVVIAKRGSDEKSMQLQGDFKVAAEGGPLWVKFEREPSATAGMDTLRIQTQLPSGKSESSSEIGLWQVDWIDANPGIAPKTIADLLKRIHDAAGGGTVAFGCQSGSTRSGALAQLYHQRDVAEKIWNEGNLPKASELMKAATEWGRRGATVRNQHFAERMPKNLLDRHAALLEEEMKSRLDESVDASRPTTPVRPKVAPKPQVAASLASPATPPQVPARPVPSPRLAAQPSPTDLVPPPKPKRSDTSDTISVRSDISYICDSSSEASSVSGVSENTYGALHEHKPHFRDSAPYGLKSGEASPARSAATSKTKTQELYAVATALREGDVARREKPAGSHALERSFRSSLRRAELAVDRLGTGGYEEVVPVMSEAASQDINNWLTGSHKLSGDLSKFLHSVARTFTEEAPRGLRLFAAKDTFGSGKVIKDIREESGNLLWAGVVSAVDETLENASAASPSMAVRMMETVMKDDLIRHFEGMDPARQRIWVRRTGEKAILSGAIQALKDEVADLNAQARAGQADFAKLKRQAQLLNLALLSFNAVHQVGNQPGIRNR